LALLTTVLVPSEYFLIVFTSIISIILLGIGSKLYPKKDAIVFSKEISYEDVILTIVLITLSGIYGLRIHNYFRLISGVIFALVFVLVVKFYAPEKFYKTISFAGMFAGVTIIFLKLWFIKFPYGTDVPLRFLLATIASKLAKKRSTISFFNSFIIATLISL